MSYDLKSRLRGLYRVGQNGEFGVRDFYNGNPPAINIEAAEKIEELEKRLAAAETAIRWMVGIYMVQDGLPDDVREYRTKKVIEAVMMIGKNLTILSREVKGE